MTRRPKKAPTRVKKSGPWTAVYDDDGNEQLPDGEQEVLVFLCGDRAIDENRPPDAGWGLRLGFFDHLKHYFRVGGKPESYVTHWMPCPPEPTV